MIRVIDNFLSPEEVADYRATIDSCRPRLGETFLSTAICDKAAIAKAFWLKHGDRLREECKIERLINVVSVARSDQSIGWHFDRTLDGDTHKVLVYLDDVAGTLFRVDGGVRTVEARPGRAVVFNYCLEHAGEAIPPGRGEKYTFGFRAVV